MNEGAQVTIEVIDSEHVVARGTRRTTWFVRTGDAWTRAADCPTATVEQRNSGPGTVWERAVLLALAVGTELMCVDTTPRDVKPKDPLSYLRGGTAGVPRATRRRYYRVAARGRVVPRVH